MVSLEEHLALLRDQSVRVGPLPAMTPANPQEQLGQFPSDWRIIDQLTDYAFALPGVIEQPTRVAPDGSRALTLEPSIAMNRQTFMVDSEFAHIHNPPTGSMHLMLPAPVRTLAIEKRWGLRHPFAVRGIGPAAAFFVYAPRDVSELEWAKALLRVSHAWASGMLSEA